MFFKKTIKFLLDPLWPLRKIKYNSYFVDEKTFLKMHFNKVIYKKNKEFFFAIYDLSYNALSYNFISFLILSEIFRKKNNYKYFNLLIIENNLHRSLRHDKFEKSYSKKNLQERFNNFLKQMSETSPNLKKVILLKKIDEAYKVIKGYETFPKKISRTRSVKNGFEKPLHTILKKDGIQSELQVKKKYQKKINQFIRSKKIITFTVRNSPFDKVRNTNYKALHQMYNKLRKNFVFVTIPDTEYPKINKKLKSKLGEMCSKNVSLRLSLYKKAKFNIFSDTGPWLLTAYSKKIPYIAIVNYDGEIYGGKKSDLNGAYDMKEKLYWSNKNQFILKGKDNWKTYSLILNKYINN